VRVVAERIIPVLSREQVDGEVEAQVATIVALGPVRVGTRENVRFAALGQGRGVVPINPEGAQVDEDTVARSHLSPGHGKAVASIGVFVHGSEGRGSAGVSRESRTPRRS
jgi:hypothetical protein